MSEKTYVGDTGTAIILDCGHDISAASARSIAVRKPDGTTTTWAALASGTTAIRFDTLAGSLDIPGDYALQPQVTLPAGAWKGKTVRLEVLAAFES